MYFLSPNPGSVLPVLQQLLFLDLDQGGFPTPVAMLQPMQRPVSAL